MGMRQAAASEAQTIRARPEGRSPFATWYSAAKYPTAANASRTKNGIVPSSGRISPNVESAMAATPPPAQNR
jgi:hypothetical protein